MTGASFKLRVAKLGLSQEEAGIWLGGSERSGQRWAKEGPPTTVAMLLIAVGDDMDKLVRLAKAAYRD